MIVGGGLTGLVCGWRLARVGHDVEVLERGSRPGGSLRRRVIGDFVLDGRVTFDPDADPALHALVRSLGLDVRLRPLGVMGDAVLHGGGVELLPRDLRGLARMPTLSRRGRLGALRGVRALQVGRGVPADLDSREAEGWLRDLCGSEACSRFLGPAIAAGSGLPADGLSGAQAARALYRHRVGGAPASLAHGNEALVNALQDGLRIRTRCEVTSVETETGGARVRYRQAGRESSVIADAAVVTLAGDRVLRLCPKLTPEERGFLGGVRYAEDVSVALLLDRRPALPHVRRIHVPTGTGLPWQQVDLLHHRPGAAPSGTGLLGLLARPAAAE